jgi:hypothetical protein
VEQVGCHRLADMQEGPGERHLQLLLLLDHLQGATEKEVQDADGLSVGGGVACACMQTRLGRLSQV